MDFHKLVAITFWPFCKARLQENPKDWEERCWKKHIPIIEVYVMVFVFSFEMYDLFFLGIIMIQGNWIYIFWLLDLELNHQLHFLHDTENYATTKHTWLSRFPGSAGVELSANINHQAWYHWTLAHPRACTLAVTPVDMYPPEQYDFVTGMTDWEGWEDEVEVGLQGWILHPWMRFQRDPGHKLGFFFG